MAKRKNVNSGRGSKKRILAAKKAARTRKRNAGLRRRKKQKHAKRKRKATIASLVRFVQGELKEGIVVDLKSFRISSEADLRSSVTFHLRKELPNPKDDKWRLSTGLRVQKQLVGNKPFDEVDVVLQYLANPTFKEYTPEIMIELKETKSLKMVDLKNDIRKLEGFRKRKICRYDFLIYLCREVTDEQELTEMALRVVRQAYLGRVIPIIINAYSGMTHSEGVLFDKRWEQSKHFEHSKSTARTAARTRIKNRKKKQ
jgi:hypothetical protein